MTKHQNEGMPYSPNPEAFCPACERTIPLTTSGLCNDCAAHEPLVGIDDREIDWRRS